MPVKKITIPPPELVQRYVDGESSVQLAREFGCTASAVLKALEKLGIPRRPAQRPVKVTYVPLQKEAR